MEDLNLLSIRGIYYEHKKHNKLIIVGMKIQKPTKETEVLKIMEDGFYYRIGKANQKKVTYEEIEEAIKEINKNGVLTRKWYKQRFPKISKDNPCNFTTIGGLLVKIQLAEYEMGKYLYKNNNND
ncbi:hypothetical protein [Clostridium sp. Marseille-Q2269]|uniref:hypothetical protein n=1 Tax=Clostridium sp. Marseille-Q2269 TaxID=2942205 RepID=UPI002074A39C|nr:hypothetical protein [Clostridium sp. Marseille-Q2269]